MSESITSAPAATAPKVARSESQGEGRTAVSSPGRIGLAEDTARGAGGTDADLYAPSSLLSWTLERRWFLQFFIGVLLCVNNGACFCFALFSEGFRHAPFEYSQSQVNLIATVGVLLSYFSFPTGFLYDRSGPTVTLLVGTVLNSMGWLGLMVLFRPLSSAPIHQRENSVAWTSATTLTANPSSFDPNERQRLDGEGYGAYPARGAAATTRSIGWVFLFYGMSQLSASFFETSAMLTNLKAFSCYTGRVVMIQKTFMGLGTSLVAQVYVAFFQSSESFSSFFCFLGLYSVAVGVLAVIHVRLPTPSTRCLGLNVMDAETVQRGGGEPTRFQRPFQWGSRILFASVGVILTISFIENCFALPPALKCLFGVLTIGLCVAFSAMIAITPSYRCNVGGYRGAALPPTEEEEEEDERVPTGQSSIRTPKDQEGYGTEAVVDATMPESVVVVSRLSLWAALRSLPALWELRGWQAVLLPQAASATPSLQLNEKTLWENMRGIDLWLLWLICFASWSAMTLVATNCSAIYQSVSHGSFSSMINAVYLSLFGVASAVGRIVVGLLHPRLVERRKVLITAFTVAAPVLNGIGLPLFLLVPAPLLFLPYLFVGLATGVSWGTTILVVTALFTPQQCGRHYSLLYTAGMLSPLVFNMALFGPVYDYVTARQQAASPTPTKACVGIVCIALPILTCFAVNLLAIPASLVLSQRVLHHHGI